MCRSGFGLLIEFPLTSHEKTLMLISKVMLSVRTSHSVLTFIAGLNSRTAFEVLQKRNQLHGKTFASLVASFIGFFCGLIGSTAAVAMEATSTASPYVFSNTQVHPIKASSSDLKHQLIITLPDSYHTQKEKAYPVVYYLDAYWDFPLLYATYGNLRYDRAIPEVILVGLSVPTGTQINNYRSQYFSIQHETQKKPITGQAELLYKHVVQDIIPFVDSHYRTLTTPSGRVLAGQSMGGLFTLYGLMQKERAFERFIAINPAVVGSEQALDKLDQARPSRTLNARLFISHGSEEYAVFRDPIIKFKKQLQKHRYPGLLLRNHLLDGMGHTGGKGEAYSKGLLWVLQDLAPHEKSGLQVDMGG
ncbi:MAG: hypothetical protein EOO68_00975 [Moraxellaceae bacterium]|nr:MAG: hypothetical protein EOO68_00975 [Moraxellaceae bacterium]